MRIEQRQNHERLEWYARNKSDHSRRGGSIVGKSRPSGPFADGFWWLDGPADRIECTNGRDGYTIQCQLYLNEAGMCEISSLDCHGLCRKRRQTEIVCVHPKCDEHRWNALVHGNTRGTDHWGNVVFVAMLIVDQRHRFRFGHETTRFGELPAALQRSIHESQGGILLGVTNMTTL